MLTVFQSMQQKTPFAIFTSIVKEYENKMQN